MPHDQRPNQPAAPLVLALGSTDAEQFVIIEGGTTDAGRRQTPHAHGPMREEKLRAVLKTDFRMESDAIQRSVEEARQHLREK
jgi:hypothetical protein